MLLQIKTTSVSKHHFFIQLILPSSPPAVVVSGSDGWSCAGEKPGVEVCGAAPPESRVGTRWDFSFSSQSIRWRLSVWGLTASALSAGKGLGRAENGISEAIKVKVKCDKGGVSRCWSLGASEMWNIRENYSEIFIWSFRSATEKESSSASTGGIMYSIKPHLACRWRQIRWVQTDSHSAKSSYSVTKCRFWLDWFLSEEEIICYIFSCFILISCWVWMKTSSLYG